MDVFDKAKEELKKYLLENKEQVVKDLDDMRKKSTGDDIYKYIEGLVNNGFLHDVIYRRF